MLRPKSRKLILQNKNKYFYRQRQKGSRHLTQTEGGQAPRTQICAGRPQARVGTPGHQARAEQSPGRTPGMGELHPSQMVLNERPPSVGVSTSSLHPADVVVGCVAAV